MDPLGSYNYRVQAELDDELCCQAQLSLKQHRISVVMTTMVMFWTNMPNASTTAPGTSSSSSSSSSSSTCSSSTSSSSSSTTTTTTTTATATATANVAAMQTVLRPRSPKTLTLLNPNPSVRVEGLGTLNRTLQRAWLLSSTERRPDKEKRPSSWISSCGSQRAVRRRPGTHKTLVQGF